jgi:hypothetical protein
MTTPTARFLTIVLAGFSLALLPFSGCSTHKEYVPETDPNAPPPPTMQGYGDFFDGKLLVEASLGRGFRMRPGRMREMANRQGRGDENPFSDVYYIDGQDEVEDQYFIPRMNNSTLPPVALRLRVTNQLQEPVEVEFLECNSLLGNFAVRPEKITIPAGETGAPDPMTSLLGLSDGEFQLKIGLKVGAAQETKIVMMHVIKDAKEAVVDKDGNLITPGKGRRRPPPPSK